MRRQGETASVGTVSGRSKTSGPKAGATRNAGSKPGPKASAKAAAAAGKAKAKPGAGAGAKKTAAKAPKAMAKAPRQATGKTAGRAPSAAVPKAVVKLAKTGTVKTGAQPAKPMPKSAMKTAAPAKAKSVPAKMPAPKSSPGPSSESSKARPPAKPRALPAANGATNGAAANGVAPKPVPSAQTQAERAAERAVAARLVKAQEKMFTPGDYVVYPTHGVGQIIGLEDQIVAGMSLRVFAISFENEKMILRVPVEKAKKSGLRPISTRKEMQSALSTLKGRARIKRVIWSRRAQEYEAKINSGSPTSIAEVVRDLHRAAGQPDQSYSERQIYEAALDRLARELALVEDIDQQSAAKRVEKMLRVA